MIYPSSNQSRQGYLEPAHAAQERSAFIYGVEYCNHFMPDAGEIKSLTPQPWSMRVSVFHMGSDSSALLGQAFGVDSKTWTRATGRDIVGVHAPKAILLGELRHCRDCLAQGWHSAMFQHPAVESCPLHRLRLQVGCPHCGASISTSMAAIGKHHLHCPDCNKALATQRRRVALGKPIVQIGVSTFAPLRASLLDTGASDLIRSPMELSRTPEQLVREPGASRELAHHLQWSSVGDEYVGTPGKATDNWLSAAEDVGLIPAAQRQRRLRTASIAALEEILQTVQQVGVAIDIPNELSSIGRSAARVDVSIGLVSAALWRTAHILDVSRFLLGELPPPQAAEQPLSAGIPPFEGIQEVVRRAQVFDVFVDGLLRMRKCQYGVQVDWNLSTGSGRLMPAWRGAAHAGRVELRLRSRSSLGVIARLARKYAWKRLEAAPDGVQPQALVRSDA